MNFKKTISPRLFDKTPTAAFLVAVASFIIYLPALGNDFVNWDDDLYVYENPDIHSLSLRLLKWSFGLHMLNWHPLTWISHALDYALWGPGPMGHHLSSILLHAANTFLFFLLSARLITSARHPFSQSGPDLVLSRKTLAASSAAALLFGLHPLHVESAAWIAERKDVLSAFFSLLSLLFYCRYVHTPDTGKRLSPYISSLFLFLLALLSKPMAVTLPVVMLLLDLYPFRRFDHFSGAEAFKKIIIEKIPFFLLGLISAVMTIIAQHSGGSVVSTNALPVSKRIVMAFNALWFYLSKMVFPFGLSPYYPVPQNVSLLSLKYLVPTVLTILASAFCIRAWKKGQKTYAVVWAYYVITLLPVIGIIQVGEQAAADRYFYLPGAGFFLLAGLGVSLTWERLSGSHGSLFRKALVMSLFLSALFGLGVTTTRQIRVWSDSITLWTHELKYYPDNWLAYLNRAKAYTRLGEFRKALEDVNKAVACNPKDARAYYIRALNYAMLGDYQKALEDLDNTVSRDPSFGKAYDIRADILAKIEDKRPGKSAEEGP